MLFENTLTEHIRISCFTWPLVLGISSFHGSVSMFRFWESLYFNTVTWAVVQERDRGVVCMRRILAGYWPDSCGLQWRSADTPGDLPSCPSDAKHVDQTRLPESWQDGMCSKRKKKKQKQKTEPILRIGTPLYRQSAINEKAKRTYKWTDEWLDGLSNIFEGASQHLKAFWQIKTFLNKSNWVRTTDAVSLLI